MILRSFILVFALNFCFHFSYSQLSIPVAPALQGDALLEELVRDYKPQNILTYGPARDSLFSKVDLHDDSLTCVYSGLTIYLDPSKDPTTAAFNNGSNNGINTEHTWPQSFGAGSGNAKSDMHHLFPTRAAVNSARQNKPFSDIADFETDSWFYLEDLQTEIPFEDQIDYYSESSSYFFEPREDHKGDVARAMFYFYTMYKQEADQSDPSFFTDQKEILCKWHVEDPVDQKEWDRSYLISKYQEDKPNPYILDCTLAERSFCSDYDYYCSPTTHLDDLTIQSEIVLTASPNPFHDNTLVSFSLDTPGDIELYIINQKGQKLKSIFDGYKHAGHHEFRINSSLISDLNAGLLYCMLKLVNQNSNEFSTFKLLKID